MSTEKHMLAMTLTKSTKGTHVYGDSSDDAPIPTVYVKKGALPDKPPQTIELIVKY